MSAAPRLLTLLLAALLLFGCNRVDLAYRNLDVIVPWTLGDYLKLERDQRQALDDALQQQLRWHCRTQLPRYVEWLQGLRDDLAQGSPSRDRLRQRLDQAEVALADLSASLVAPSVELLRELDDAQVRSIEQNLAEKLSEAREKYVEPPLAEQIQSRAERMQERLEDWLGRLDASQRQRVMQWSASLGEQYRLWLDNRAQWQAHFVAALRERQAADFPERLETLLEHRERLWSEAYREAYPRTEAALLDLLADVLADLQPAQRAHLQERLQRLQEQLRGIRCQG